MKFVDRCVFTGGFASGEQSVATVLNELEQRGDFAKLEGFSFSEVVANPEAYTKAVKDAKIILTHSAGVLLALENANHGQEIHAIAPPLRRSVVSLMTILTVRKMQNMHAGIDSYERQLAVKLYEQTSTRELARHPYRNFSQLGKIANFDIREQNGFPNPMSVGLMDDDAFYGMTDLDYMMLCEAGNNIQYVSVAGEHDELLLDPQKTLDDFYGQLSRIH